MQEKNFKVEFLGTTYNAWYVKEISTARQILIELEEKQGLFGIDTETAPLQKYAFYPEAGLSPHLSDVRLIQVFDGKNTIVFDMMFIKDYSLFVPFLEAKKFIAHNAIFDLQYFLKMGVSRMSLGCTRILAKLLFHAVYPTDSGTNASLADLAEKFLKTPLLKIHQTSNWSAPDLTFEQVEYAALDAICVLKLAEKLAPGLTKYGLERVYTLNKDAQWPLAKMQINGLAMNSIAHKKLIDRWRAEVAVAKKEVTRITEINDVTSSKIADYLLDKLPKDVLKFWPRTPKGKLSTSADTFADFSYLDIVKPMLAFQKAATLSSTFGQGLMQLVNPETKRVHSKYKICGARTGRLSSTDPNSQNMPRTDEFRNLFIASEGKKLLVADYSQIELRVAAELSQDKNMLKVYEHGQDIYKVTAARLANKKIEEVSKGERQVAKALALGLLFGLGSQKFSHYARKGYGVDISDGEAGRAILGFRELYSGYREWQLNQAEEAKETLLAYTPCGKRRRLLEDNSYGASMNTPIQGGAAEIILYSIVDLEKKGFKLLSTIHDECILEIDTGIEEDVSIAVNKSMTEAYLKVFPNGVTNKLVNIGIGDTWAQAK